MASNPYFITDDHYNLFGRIVSNYARAEMGFRFLIGQMVHLPMEVVLLFTSPYTALHLRNVTKSIARIVMHDDPKLLETLASILGTHKSLSQVRNDISHNLWRRGEGDIIVPMQSDVREGKLQFTGIPGAERRYSLKNLETAMSRSVTLNTDLINFHDCQQLLDCIARNADLSSLDMDAILGIS